jgi:hypothetical protein
LLNAVQKDNVRLNSCRDIHRFGYIIRHQYFLGESPAELLDFIVPAYY